MPVRYAIVDLFAGPGGLAEGFSSFETPDGTKPFEIVLSVEKEASAHQTLLLRAFLRQFGRKLPAEYYAFLNGTSAEPDWQKLYPTQWRKGREEALCLELGSPDAWDVLEQRFERIARQHGNNIILIGGPPCQAYSLVGRARNKGVRGYAASKDERHFLYREYIRILDRLRPAVFVMENVKGMLSSSVDGERIFDHVLDDLCAVGDSAYVLVPLQPRSGLAAYIGKSHPPVTDFVVRTEELGIPQARHRVIVVGVRRDLIETVDLASIYAGLLDSSEERTTVEDVLSGLPVLRSGISTPEDSFERWSVEVSKAAKQLLSMASELPKDGRERFRAEIERVLRKLKARSMARSSNGPPKVPASCPSALRKWLHDPRLSRVPNHESRGHMVSDLGRYLFASSYAATFGVSPKATEFPKALEPAHRNWKSGKFTDRFRVQLRRHPATTVTSHISKDGHYFIHPDPAQCRSLTVREAARLQTFPDNYFFKGNRTQQYVQVGNAVPPFLARAIAKALHGLIDGASRHSTQGAERKLQRKARAAR